jgi:hypothetical protein
MMDKRIAQNALNFLLSDRMTYKGPDTLPLVEIVRELQKEVEHGNPTNPQSGSDQTED